MGQELKGGSRYREQASFGNGPVPLRTAPGARWHDRGHGSAAGSGDLFGNRGIGSSGVTVNGDDHSSDARSQCDSGVTKPKRYSSDSGA